MIFYLTRFCISIYIITEALACLDNIYSKFPLPNYYLVSTAIFKPNYTRSRAKRGMKTDECTNVYLNFSNYNYEMCIEKYSISDHEIINKNTKFIVYKNDSKKTYNVNQLNIKFAKGYIINKPYSSAFSGYIINNKLYGKMEMESKIFYIEPLDKFPCLKSTTKNAVIYEVTWNNISKEPFFYGMNYYYKKPFNLRKKRNAAIANGKVCPLMVLIDNSFLRIIGKNNVKSSVKTVLQSLDLANAVFRITDFNNDGVPDNVGFTIKYVIVLKSENVGLNNLPPYSERPIDGKLYLRQFSKYELLSDVCLGTAFSAQPFMYRALGLSYTAVIQTSNWALPKSGGICERPSHLDFEKNFNNLVITYRLEHGEGVTQITTDLSLVHELGHSFGSDHDITSECFGHIMSPHTVNGTYRHNLLFSKCSKIQIANVIENQGYCLEKNTVPFCGNGLVEENEDCDCGLTFNCIQRDPCCVPRNTKGPNCKTNKKEGYECHPSQGLCCMSNCEYRNISYLGLSCENFDKKCPCSSPSKICNCGILGTCIKDTCHSYECTRIGMKECMCRDLEGAEKCVTCCLGPGGKCLPSNILTEIITADNERTIDKLWPHSVQTKNISNASIASYKQYCVGSKCITLVFRSFNKGSFCLFKGELGICQSNSICFVPKFMLSILPDIRLENYANNIYQKELIFILVFYIVFTVIII